jgi:hypothetical protein
MKPYIILLFIFTNFIAIGQHKSEWEVNSLNTGKGFFDIQTLDDGSVLSQLVYCTSRNDLPSAFYDSQNNPISFSNSYTYNHELKNDKTLIKFNKEGVYQWSNRYNNTHYYSDTETEFDFVGYKVMRGTQIIVLAKYGELYFRNIDYEKEMQGEFQYGEDEEENYGETYNEESTENVKDRSAYGLQFLSPSTGNIDSVLFINDLNSNNTEIYNIENLGNNIIILAGRTYSDQIKKSDSLLVKNEDQYQGYFVVAINLENGEILWSDNISHGPKEKFYLSETRNNSHLSVSKEGSIYFSCQHHGDVAFSNHKQVQSESVDKNNYQSWTYLISYSGNGGINWVKNNQNVSYPHAMTSSSTGVYIAQSSNGRHSFDLSTDTTNFKYVCVSFVNKEGVELWVNNFPISKINSIQLDHNNLPIIQGVYNGISLRTPKFQINERVCLNDKNDFYIIKLKKNGNISSVFTEKLRIQDHLYSLGTTFNLIDSKYIYLSYHSKKYFTKEEREKQGINMHDQNAFGDLCKLVKINLNTLKFD